MNPCYPQGRTFCSSRFAQNVPYFLGHSDKPILNLKNLPPPTVSVLIGVCHLDQSPRHKHHFTAPNHSPQMSYLNFHSCPSLFGNSDREDRFIDHDLVHFVNGFTYACGDENSGNVKTLPPSCSFIHLDKASHRADCVLEELLLPGMSWEPCDF